MRGREERRREERSEERRGEKRGDAKVNERRIEERRGAESYVVTSKGSTGCNTIMKRIVQFFLPYGIACLFSRD